MVREMHPFDGRVVSTFIRQALEGNDITLFGDGSQTRSFCYRNDLVDVIIEMMNQDGFIGPVNIGTPRRIHDQGTRRASHRAFGVGERFGLSATSFGRSHTTTPGHLFGQGKTQLGAENSARPRTRPDNRVVSKNRPERLSASNTQL